MRTFAVVLIAVALSVEVAPRTCIASPARLTDDSYTRAGSAAGFGKRTTLDVSLTGSGTERTWVKFDLSTLPPGTVGSNISKATLTLWVNKIRTPGAFEVRRVLGGWQEGALTDESAPPVGAVEATITLAPGDVRSYVVVDVTGVVKDWLDGVSGELGLGARTDSRRHVCSV